MPVCDTCGNDYARAFTLRTHEGEELTFDSLECAAHLMAPTCGHCGCRVLGHGIQVTDQVYCCASCARHDGVEQAVDHVEGNPDQ